MPLELGVWLKIIPFWSIQLANTSSPPKRSGSGNITFSDIMPAPDCRKSAINGAKFCLGHGHCPQASRLRSPMFTITTSELCLTSSICCSVSNVCDLKLCMGTGSDIFVYVSSVIVSATAQALYKYFIIVV